jgi:pyrroline-5-carboxylate reductase
MEKNNYIVAIIGAGNMGGAIAKGFSYVDEGIEVRLSDISAEKLDGITVENPEIAVSTSNTQILADADIVILAVKPWLIASVAEEIKPFLNLSEQIIVSVAAGVNLDQLHELIGSDAIIYRAIPNTAVEVFEGVTAISSRQKDEEINQTVTELFEELGQVFFVPETQLNAYMSLASCGIAYAFRYVRAAMQGAVEMGIPSAQALEVIIQTLKGAAETLYINDSHPEAEIDKVTTPGGITIKGLNAMEAHGFSNAVIQGLKASHLK